MLNVHLVKSCFCIYFFTWTYPERHATAVALRVHFLIHQLCLCVCVCLLFVSFTLSLLIHHLLWPQRLRPAWDNEGWGSIAAYSVGAGEGNIWHTVKKTVCACVYVCLFMLYLGTWTSFHTRHLGTPRQLGTKTTVPIVFVCVCVCLFVGSIKWTWTPGMLTSDGHFCDFHFY